MFRMGLYARVSADDLQTLPMLWLNRVSRVGAIFGSAIFGGTLIRWLVVIFLLAALATWLDIERLAVRFAE